MTFYVAAVGAAAIAVVMLLFRSTRATKALGLTAIVVSFACLRASIRTENLGEPRAARELREMCVQFAARTERIARDWAAYRPSVLESSQRAYLIEVGMEVSCIRDNDCVPSFTLPDDVAFSWKAMRRAELIRKGTCVERRD